MPIPKLQNATTVEIGQINEDKTAYSNRRREPINHVQRFANFKIKAQIFFGETEFIGDAMGMKPSERNLAGSIMNAKGYIVVRKLDLQTLGKTLSKGDKLSSYGNAGSELSCEFYLLGKKDAGQYSSVGQCTLEKWFFEDRE